DVDGLRTAAVVWLKDCIYEFVEPQLGRTGQRPRVRDLTLASHGVCYADAGFVGKHDQIDEGTVAVDGAGSDARGVDEEKHCHGGQPIGRGGDDADFVATRSTESLVASRDIGISEPPTHRTTLGRRLLTVHAGDE